MLNITCYICGIFLHYNFRLSSNYVIAVTDFFIFLCTKILFHFVGRPYYRSSLWYSISSVYRLSVRCLSICNVLYCGEMVRPSEKVSEGANRKPGSKSSFFGSPTYFYFQFRLYGHRDGRFWLIFGRIFGTQSWEFPKSRVTTLFTRPATVRKSKLYVKSQNVSVET